jgi:hypothetical protein
MNKPKFGNYNIVLWQKLFKNIECEQIKKYYSNWTSNIAIDKECNEIQKKFINVETLFEMRGTNGIAINNDGLIIISNNRTHCIHFFKDRNEIDKIECIIDKVPFNYPCGIAIKPNGEIIIVDNVNNRICLIKNRIISVIAGSDSGEFGYNDGPGNTAKFNSPNGVAICNDGTIIVTDTENNCIRAISTDYNVSTIAGSINGVHGNADGKGSEARFNHPTGIAIMKDQTIIVVDSMNHCIRSIDKDYVVRTIAGSTKGYADGNRTNAQFKDLYDICIMKDQTIIVTDAGNNCIRSINTNGDVKTITGYERDNHTGLGFITKFKYPHNITIDAYDNIFVYNSGNYQIRKLYYK